MGSNGRRRSHVVCCGDAATTNAAVAYRTTMVCCWVPPQVCMDETADVLLAYKMNGKDLAPDHGYPIRLIVPGYIGGRMVSDTETRRVVLAYNDVASRIPYPVPYMCFFSSHLCCPPAHRSIPLHNS